jgi:hypothetical protein
MRRCFMGLPGRWSRCRFGFSGGLVGLVEVGTAIANQPVEIRSHAAREMGVCRNMECGLGFEAWRPIVDGRSP